MDEQPSEREMTCAYCNRRYPWTTEFFPTTVYAECWDCRNKVRRPAPKRRWWRRDL